MFGTLYCSMDTRLAKDCLAPSKLLNKLDLYPELEDLSIMDALPCIIIPSALYVGVFEFFVRSGDIPASPDSALLIYCDNSLG